MADVLISQLPIGTPSGSAVIPYSQSGTTYSARPSAIVAASSGSVLQVQCTVNNTKIGPITNSDTECYRGTITPKYNTSKILIQTSFQWSSSNPNGGFAIQKSIDNGSNWTAVSVGTAGGTLSPPRTVTGIFVYYDDTYLGTYNMTNVSYNIIDTPNTTNQIIYRVYWYHLYQNGGTFYFNYALPSANNNPDVSGSSTIILTEIAA